MSGTLLRLTDLTKTYPHGVTANDAVSFDVAAGEVVGLLGHNGAGKTTLVRQVSGALRPTSGTITLDRHDLVRDPAAARRLCSVQAQGHVPINGLTPRTAITLVGRLRGAPRLQAEAAAALLAERLKIEDWVDRRTSPGEELLSGGVLRLVAFCMAAVAPGPLVILDEPTNDVDPMRRRLLWAEIRRLASDGHAVVLVTHNVAEAERSVDRVLILHRGRLIANDSPAALMAAVHGRLRVDVVWEAEPPPRLPGFLADAVPHARGLTTTVDRSRLGEVLAWGDEMSSQGVVEQLGVANTSLDDAYAQIIDADDQARGESAPTDHVSEAVPDDEKVLS